MDNEKQFLDSEELKRVRNLFEIWKAWLFFLSSAYIIGFFLWTAIQTLISRMFYQSVKYKNLFFILISLFAIVVRGLMFCADGLVTSYLKSPFNQICYSINKLKGLEQEKSDEIVSILTEINEHLKETFKKFGITTISSSLAKTLQNFLQSFLKGNSEEKDSKKNSEFGYFFGVLLPGLELMMTASFLIPIALAYSRLLDVEGKINEIEKLAEKESKLAIEQKTEENKEEENS